MLVVFLGVVLLLCCSAAFHMFHYSVVCQYSVVPPVVRCSDSVPAFASVPSVSQCSAGVPFSVVPCFGVPGFIVCLAQW